MAGAGKGKGKGPAIASGAVIGGFCLLGLVLFGIAVTIVISIISVYTSNHSVQPNADYYRIRGLALKVLLTGTNGSFTGGSVLNSLAMSSLCTTVYAGSAKSSNFAACILKNFIAYSANTSTTGRRRRQAVSIGTFQFGSADIIYSTTCGTSSDAGKASNATSLSSCTRTRLNDCNSIIGNNSFLTWQPILSGTTQSIYANNTAQPVTLSVTNVFAMGTAQALDYASRSGFSAGTLSLISLRCEYVGQVTAAQAAAIIAAGLNNTQTATATTISSG